VGSSTKSNAKGKIETISEHFESQDIEGDSNRSKTEKLQDKVEKPEEEQVSPGLMKKSTYAENGQRAFRNFSGDAPELKESSKKPIDKQSDDASLKSDHVLHMPTQDHKSGEDT